MADTSFNAIKLIPFDHYLVRPMMLRGESLRGFVYRFYDANGLKVPKMVSTQITHLSTVEVERQATRGAQKYLIGADVNLSEYDFFNQYVVVPKKRKKFRSDNFAQHRFCPACLNEKFTHYAVWDLPMFTACPKHFCRLVSLCEQCKLAFKWLTLDVKW